MPARRANAAAHGTRDDMMDALVGLRQQWGSADLVERGLRNLVAREGTPGATEPLVVLLKRLALDGEGNSSDSIAIRQN